MYFTNLCLYKTKEIQMLFQSLDPAHNNIMHSRSHSFAWFLTVYVRTNVPGTVVG